MYCWSKAENHKSILL